MGTFVTIDVVREGTEIEIERAFGWFRAVEACCTRFDAASELMRLSARPGVAVHVSEMLFEAVQFAVAVAEDTDGAFDPTVGGRMVARGFDREHRTDRRVEATAVNDADVASYRDVLVDPGRRTILLRRPLTLDLGAVAKGLAVDAAARELQPCEDFAIDAGGDLFLGGRNRRGDAWSVGIRHPRIDGELIETVHVSGQAVCTSGDYERRLAPEAGNDRESNGGEHHLIDPRTGSSPASVASVTVIAPNAMIADALATAAFVLGPGAGMALIERHDLHGLIVDSEMRRHMTSGFPRG
jgi:thiamine biosynthesis lipoprotein